MGGVWRDFDKMRGRIPTPVTTQEVDANNPSVMADGHDTSAALRRTTQCAPQGYLLRGEHRAAFTQGRRMPRRCRGIGAMWASPPTEGLSGVRSFVVSPSGASRHLPRRGRLDATALPWQRGDAPQGYLFRFAPLRGHRPLRKVCRGLRSVGSGHIFFLMAEMAPFSRRDTWAWEMPISVETSIWVLPWQKRRARMLRWRSSRRAMASLRAM